MGMLKTEVRQAPAIAGPNAGWLAGVRVRTLERADLPALEWEGAYTHYRRLYDLAYRRALRGNAVLWVAEISKVLVGQLFVLLRSEVDPRTADGRQRAFIHSFRVRPECRGRGLGSRILERAEADLRGRGFRWASLNVARDNPAAIRLYERAGYRIVGEEEGRWSYVDHEGVERQVHEPSWRMRKRLQRGHPD
jgi:ribosomal protein S18 acetylase RimI-like enzyme